MSQPLRTVRIPDVTPSGSLLIEWSWHMATSVLSNASDGAFRSIDCDGCAMQNTDVCSDCVVTFLCREERSAKVIDLVEVRALRALEQGGLVPALRHLPVEDSSVVTI
jgi:hypothetical protein